MRSRADRTRRAQKRITKPCAGAALSAATARRSVHFIAGTCGQALSSISDDVTSTLGFMGRALMSINRGEVPPILAQKHYTTPSAFTPENLLREARRQKRITGSDIPAVCVLDPDGDIVRSLNARGDARLTRPGPAITRSSIASAGPGSTSALSAVPSARRSRCWCRRSCSPGAALLISVTSAGQIAPLAPAALFRADRPRAARRRHQLSLPPPSEFAVRIPTSSPRAPARSTGFAVPVSPARPGRRCAVSRDRRRRSTPCAPRGCWRSRWKPPRSTPSREAGNKAVLCFAHVTNQMGRVDGDFEKGEADGSTDALNLIAIAAGCLRSRLKL